MILGAIERVLFGSPTPSHPLQGWVCPCCFRPLDQARSVHSYGRFLVCDLCHEGAE